MPVPANRVRFLFSVAGVSTELRVLDFKCSEAVSNLFQLDLEIVCTRADLDLEDLLNRDAVLEMAGDSPRSLHGSIRSAAQGATSKRFTHYHLQVVPRLFWLGLRHNLHIFQNLSVPDIVRQLLTEAGFDTTCFRFELRRSYPVRIYCVQYNESELHFIERLLTEEGIHYHFEHHRDRHVLVMADHAQAFRPLAPRSLPFRADAAMVGEPCVRVFQPQRMIAIASVALNDYNFRKPNHSLLAEAKTGADQQLFSYSWPGNYSETPQGQSHSQDQLAALRVSGNQIAGQSVIPALVPGSVFDLRHHARANFNRDYVVLAVQHQGRQPQVLEEYAGSGGSQYRNWFEAFPADQEFRPPLDRQKPLARAQTAVVVGPPGEKIYTDESGNLQVRFHWDREDKNTCWLRLAQSWAGSFWGTVVIPRVGQEVLVEFKDGDPDQPLITGCFYHGLHKQAYALPEHKSRSLLRSQSLAGGDGHEILLEDRAGQEKIAVHSSRDLELHVTQDSKTRIDRNADRFVGGEDLITIQGTQHFTVNGERRTKIAECESLSVGQSVHVKTGQGLHQQAGQQLHLKAGMRLVIEAASAIHLKAGAGSVLIEPGGVHLNGPVIGLNGGGGSSSAQSASPQGPTQVSKFTRVGGGQQLMTLPTRPQHLIPVISFAELGSEVTDWSGILRAESSGSPLADITFDLRPESEITLRSKYAHDQLLSFATDVSEIVFIRFLMNIFGTDIPVSAYSQLYLGIKDKQFQPPEIVVYEGSSSAAAYNKAEQKVYVSESLVKAAIKGNNVRIRLLAALVEEYGHYLDDMLRTKFSVIGGDAKTDEGALYAYQLFDLGIERQKNVHFADVVSDEYTGPLRLELGELHAKAKALVAQPYQMDEDNLGDWEFFGAGMGDPDDPDSYGHEKIEFVLREAGFDPLERKKIYFGNWLRDFSQIVDPQVVRPRPELIAKVYAQRKAKGLGPLLELIGAGLSREALTKLMAVLAAKEFGQEAYHLLKGPQGPRILGVYRPEEHIDNPMPPGEPATWEDAAQIDPAFASPPRPEQLALDPTTGMKNYIATPTPGQSFPTAREYMEQELKLAMAAGRTDEGLRHFGQALHVLEDFFSHSNFVELSLIKLGYPVYPWVEVPKGTTRIPLVTGRFGRYDVLASIGPKIAELFPVEYTQYQSQKPGDRGATDQAILIVLQDLAQAQKLDPSKRSSNHVGQDYALWLEHYEKYLQLRDELRRNTDNPVAQFALKALHNLGWLFTLVANFSIHYVLQAIAHSIDDVQTLATPLGTDPTHSQLAKDHDGHHFHVLAAKVAEDAVLGVGRSMRAYWDGDLAVSPVDRATSYLKHPVDINTFDEIVRRWAVRHPAQIQRGKSATIVKHVHHEGERTAEDLAKWLAKQEKAFNRAYEKISTFVQLQNHPK